MNAVALPEPRTLTILKALANDIRYDLVRILARGERCVCDLEALLGLPQSKVSYHLAVLRDAGLPALGGLDGRVAGREGPGLSLARFSQHWKKDDILSFTAPASRPRSSGESRSLRTSPSRTISTVAG